MKSFGGGRERIWQEVTNLFWKAKCLQQCNWKLCAVALFFMYLIWFKTNRLLHYSWRNRCYMHHCVWEITINSCVPFLFLHCSEHFLGVPNNVKWKAWRTERVILWEILQEESESLSIFLLSPSSLSPQAPLPKRTKKQNETKVSQVR